MGKNAFQASLCSAFRLAFGQPFGIFYKIFEIFAIFEKIAILIWAMPIMDLAYMGSCLYGAMPIWDLAYMGPCLYGARPRIFRENLHKIVQKSNFDKIKKRISIFT